MNIIHVVNMLCWENWLVLKNIFSGTNKFIKNTRSNKIINNASNSCARFFFIWCFLRRNSPPNFKNTLCSIALHMFTSSYVVRNYNNHYLHFKTFLYLITARRLLHRPVSRWAIHPAVNSKEFNLMLEITTN